MARQRSGSGSSRPSKGSRGSSGGRSPGNRTPGGKPPTAKPATEPAPVEEPTVEETTVEETIEVEETAPAEEPVALGKPAMLDKAADVDEDVDEDEVEAVAEVEESEEDADEESDEDADAADDAVAGERSEATDEFWDEVKVEPIEIALPKGVGYTLRAYRMSDQVAAVDIVREDDAFAVLNRRHDPDPDEVDLDEEYLEDDDEDDDVDPDELEDDELDDDESDQDDESDDDDLDDDEPDDDESDDDEDEDDDEEEEEDDEPEPQEVPVFLGQAGQLYLFRTPQALVDFVRESDEHDMVQLDTWSTLRERITVADVVPKEEDRYELDLVVENLRGGADTLDADLLIRAGEVVRDLGYAMRLDAVMSAMAEGSPLDDLDEAVRAAEEGGFKAFRARRRLRRIVTDKTPLGWRSIIGKISGVVDWRD